MAKYNKVVVASLMFAEAHKRFVNAKEDMDYINSILLSGSVIGIIAPFLKEQGGRTSHELSAKLCNLLVEDGEKCDFHEGIFRETYNSFKHAGNRKKKVKASDDLIIETNLKLEAAHLLDDAKDDFNAITVKEDIIRELSDEFLTLLESVDGYA
jgi:hypothetical protein